MFERGQGISIDFTFAVFIFLLIFAGIVGIWGFNANALQQSNAAKDMEERAMQVMEVLVKSKGSPEDWETLPVSSVQVIGLAERDRVLDPNKVIAFSNLVGADYDTSKEILNTAPFDYFFWIDNDTPPNVPYQYDAGEISAGIQPAAPAYQTVVTRIINYEGDMNVARFMLYQIR